MFLQKLHCCSFTVTVVKKWDSVLSGFLMKSISMPRLLYYMRVVQQDHDDSLSLKESICPNPRLHKSTHHFFFLSWQSQKKNWHTCCSLSGLNFPPDNTHTRRILMLEVDNHQHWSTMIATGWAIHVCSLSISLSMRTIPTLLSSELTNQSITILQMLLFQINCMRSFLWCW